MILVHKCFRVVTTHTLRVEGLGFGDWGLGFGVWGLLGFRVYYIEFGYRI